MAMEMAVGVGLPFRQKLYEACLPIEAGDGDRIVYEVVKAGTAGQALPVEPF